MEIYVVEDGRGSSAMGLWLIFSIRVFGHLDEFAQLLTGFSVLTASELVFSTRYFERA